MLHGEVIGTVWSSVKVAGLDHRKLLLVRPVDHSPDGTTPGILGTLVAVDCVDAGVGDHVVVALGRAARNAVYRGGDLPIEAAIIAILDGWESSGSASEPVAPQAPQKKSRSGKKASTKAAGRPKKKRASKKKASRKGAAPRPAAEETGELFSDVSVVPENEAELPGFGDVDDIWDSADDDSESTDGKHTDS